MTKALFHLRQFRLLLLVLLCALYSLPLSAQEKEAYVVQNKDEGTLTFYYGAKRQSRWPSGIRRAWTITRNGKTSDSYSDIYLWGNRIRSAWAITRNGKTSDFYLWRLPPWAGTDDSPNNVVTKVVFDASFKDFRPITTKGWFSYLKSLTTIEGLENLNTSEVTDMSEMFSGCFSLTSLDLSSFNTSAVTNMSDMFSGCSRLTELNVSNFNTSKVTDMNKMFYGCSTLISLNLSNFNTSAVTNMSFMFYGCSSLTKLNVSSFNTSAVTSMDWMFKDCSNLTSLNLSNFNTSAVTKMERMFKDCSNLTSLNLSNFNTSAVTNMSYMFYGCSRLPNLDLSSFNTSAVTNMSDMFSGCSGLTSLNLSNFNISAVTSMDWMFSGCSGLKELNLSNFNTSKVTDYMSYMFSGCSSLKTIFNPNTWRCEESQDMFKGCTQLKGAVKYDASKVDVTMANPITGYFTTDPNRKLEVYVLQSEDQHTLTFYYDDNRKLRSGKTWNIDEKSSSSKPVWAGTDSTANKAVTKVVFDASFKDFRPTTTEGWFFNLSALTTIEGLENLNTSAVTDMRGMFYGCSGLKTIINTQTWRCEKSQDMFKGCTQLKGAVKYDESKVDVTMANPTTGYFTDPNRKVEAYVSRSEDQHTLTFYYDNNRKLRNGETWDIDEKKKNNIYGSEAIPAWAGTYVFPNKVVTKVVFDASFKDFQPLTTYSWFYNLKALTTIEGLENLNTSAVTDMSEMFSGCSGLTSLNVSNFNTSEVKKNGWNVLSLFWFEGTQCFQFQHF